MDPPVILVNQTTTTKRGQELFTRKIPITRIGTFFFSLRMHLQATKKETLELFFYFFSLVIPKVSDPPRYGVGLFFFPRFIFSLSL